MPGRVDVARRGRPVALGRGSVGDDGRLPGMTGTHSDRWKARGGNQGLNITPANLTPCKASDILPKKLFWGCLACFFHLYGGIRQLPKMGLAPHPDPRRGAHLAGPPSAGGVSGRGSAGSAGWRPSAGGRPASPTPGCRSAPSRPAWPRSDAWGRPWSGWRGTAWPGEGHRGGGGGWWWWWEPYEHLPEQQNQQQHTAANPPSSLQVNAPCTKDNPAPF